MKKQIKGNSVASSMVFKTMERYVVMAFQMVVQIVIARILSPHEYGIVAMMTVFISVATIFIQNGFNMALVQKKDADETDFSTALIVNMIIGCVMYLIVSLSSPLIAKFYNQPYIENCLPVLSLLLVFGSINSIQIAIANRKMMFKSLFKCNVVASLFSGINGIVAALLGLGVWALIIQQLSSSIVLSIMLYSQQHWKPNWKFNKASAKNLFSFGWKLLAAGLLNQIYKELNSLVIGKQYTSSDLAFYTKGSQFPKYITTGVDSSIGSVMFSAFSKNQNDENALHLQMKKTIVINSFFVFPILAILGAAAEPIVEILLTTKWLPLVPYMQICCVTFALHPLASTQMQAIAAVGRSDVRLKIELIKKGIGIALLFLSVNYGPLAIAFSAAVSGIIGVIIGAIAGKRTTGYPLSSLITDLGPIFLITAVMTAVICCIKFFQVNPFIMLIIQAITGILIYLGLSKCFNLFGYTYLTQVIKQIHNKKYKR